MATSEKIILGDDDIRYTPSQIEQIADMLERFDVVRPQNYFNMRWIGRSADDAKTAAPSAPELTSSKGLLDPPFWAKMEAARMLINRAALKAADYPGTCAFRKGFFLRAGAYDGNVLFDNEELIRHLARSGADILYANDLFIEKRAPTFRKWLEQRPRQAYEDFGLRAKTALFAALPLLTIGAAIVSGIRSMVIVLGAMALLSMGMAWLGRTRGRARRFFPLHICLFAPVWVLERALSTYSAFYWFFRRGGYPFGGQLLEKGIGRDWVEGGRIAAQRVATLRSQSERLER